MPRRHTRLVTVDSDTGEVMTGVLAYLPNRPRIRERFFMAFQDAFDKLAEDRTLGHQAVRVLFKLFAKLDFENYLYVPQTEIARQLGMGQSDVSKAIKKLVDRGIIELGPKVGGVRTMRLDDKYGWKGRAEVYQLEQRRKLRVVPGSSAEPEEGSEATPSA